jgi:flagellar motility protein MotE (MotC chaperone)
MAADTSPEAAAPEGAAEAAPAKVKDSTGPTPDAAPSSGEAPAAKPEPKAAAPAAAGDLPLANSRGEADVLERLGERRAALDAREKDVVLREKMLDAAERQIDAKISELKQLEQKLEALVSKRNELEETQISSLVKTYESMKPEDAARIFNRLERGILVDVASRMKPAKIGAVLAAMEPARAQDLTVLLARRLKVTLNAPAVPAETPAGAPAAVPVSETPPPPNG